MSQSTNVTELAEFFPYPETVTLTLIDPSPLPERPSFDLTVKSPLVAKIVAFTTLEIDIYPTVDFIKQHGLEVGSSVVLRASREYDDFDIRCYFADQQKNDWEWNHVVVSPKKIDELFGSYEAVFANPGLVIDNFKKIFST